MKTVRNIILFSLLITTIKIYSQDRRQERERISSMKIGFITERLNLTPEEAKTFWPVYNMYSEELQKNRMSRRDNFLNARDNFDSLSDSEVDKAVDNDIHFRQNEIDIEKKYLPQFKKVLPIKKVAKLYKAEEEFKMKLLEMIKERREGNHQEFRDHPAPMH